MSLVNLTALTILVALNILPHFKVGRIFFERHHQKIFWFSVGLVGLAATLMSGSQYQVWSSGELSKFLLPPHQSVNYFIFYSLARFYAPYLISFLVALLALWVFPRINKRYGGKFFEKDEPYLAATSIFLVAHPGWLIYLVLLVSIYVLWHLWMRFIPKEEGRLPLYKFWPSVALLSLIVSTVILPKTKLWLLLKI